MKITHVRKVMMYSNPQISSMNRDHVDKDHLKGKGVEEAFRLLSEEVLTRLEVFVNIKFL